MAETRSITSALACSHPLVGKGAVEFFPGGGQVGSGNGVGVLLGLLVVVLVAELKEGVLLGGEHLKAVAGGVQVVGEVLGDAAADLRLRHLLDAGALLEESLVDGTREGLDLLVDSGHGGGFGGLNAVQVGNAEQERKATDVPKNLDAR